MDGVVQLVSAIIVTLIGTIGSVVVVWLRVRNRGIATGATAAKRWRDQAEDWKARSELVTEERDDAIAGRRTDAEAAERAIKAERDLRAAAEGRLATTQHDLDDCSRQRDNAYSELRIRKSDDAADTTRSRQRTARRDARDGDV